MNSKIYIAISVVGLIADQFIKYIVLNTPKFSDGVFVNQNFAWSLPLSNTFSLVLMILVLLVLFYIQATHTISAIWLLIAGAISNTTDRIIHYGVVDYIIVPWGGIINLADVMIFVGVILLIFNVRRDKNRNF